jgi:hypothetical protein
MDVSKLVYFMIRFSNPITDGAGFDDFERKKRSIIMIGICIICHDS